LEQESITIQVVGVRLGIVRDALLTYEVRDDQEQGYGY